MLLPSTRFIDTPVMSLQTGSELGRTVRPIINPRELSIVAFELHGINLDYDPSLLRINDIREIGPMGMIIDSSDEQKEKCWQSDRIYTRRIQLFHSTTTGQEATA